MNKSELVKALADQANISLDEATLVVNTFVDSMKESLLEGGREALLRLRLRRRELGEDPVAETAELKKRLAALHEQVVSEYPVDPQGKWWAPARFGGTAPTPEEALELDAAELKARAERAKMKK